MRQQFRHRRDDLHVHVVKRHVIAPARRIPTAGIDDAKHFAVDQHRGGLAPLLH